eukprot:5113317-Pyramimonas_sp.AAC.1
MFFLLWDCDWSTGEVGNILGMDEQKAREERRDKLLSQLLHIAWCPVLAEAPAEGLPWHPSPARVAPPRQ